MFITNASRQLAKDAIRRTRRVRRLTIVIALATEFAATGRPAIAESIGGCWEAFENGPDGAISSLVVFNEPQTLTRGPVLYAGGRFRRAGDSPARCVARWQDSSWSAVGDGVDGASVEALAVFDEDGDGPNPPALFAAGSFDAAGGVRSPNIARWNGQEWSAVGGGISGMVTDLALYDEDYDGPHPPALFAVGMFSRAGSIYVNNIARWDGNEWSALGEGLRSPAYCLTVGDPDGSGPARPRLVVGGMNSVDQWDGTTWSSFGSPGFRTFALAAFDDDRNGTNSLFAGGQLIDSGADTKSTIARWDGNAWSFLPDYLDERVYALTVFDPDGDGPLNPRLWVAGSFTKIGGRGAHGLAMWVGANWTIIENGPRSDPLSPRMNCLVTFDRDASGPRMPALCVGGNFAINGDEELRNVAGWSVTPQPVNPP